MIDTDNINIVGEVVLRKEDTGEVVFKSQNEITQYGKLFLITNLFTPRNDKWLDGISILECQRYNNIQLNSINDYRNRQTSEINYTFSNNQQLIQEIREYPFMLYDVVDGQTELVPPTGYYFQDGILYDSTDNVVDNYLLRFRLNRRKIIPYYYEQNINYSIPNGSGGYDDVSRYIKDNGKGGLFYQEEGQTDFEGSIPIGQIDYENGIIKLVKQQLYYLTPEEVRDQSPIESIDEYMFTDIESLFTFEQSGMEIRRRYMLTRTQNWTLQTSDGREFRPILKSQVSNQDTRKKYKNEYKDYEDLQTTYTDPITTEEMDLQLYETEEFRSLFNNNVFSNDQINLVLNFPINTISTEGFNTNQLLLSFGNLIGVDFDSNSPNNIRPLDLNDIEDDTSEFKFISEKITYENTDPITIQNLIQTNPEITNEKEQLNYLQQINDNREQLIRNQLLPFSFILLNEDQEITPDQGLILTWTFKFVFNRQL